MRVPYIPPSENSYDLVFNEKIYDHTRGGGVNDIHVYKPVGGGLFGILGRIVQRAIPFLKSIVLPEVGSFTNNVLNDVSRNAPVRESLRKNFKTSVKNLGKRVVGGARTKVRKSTRKKNKNKNIKKKTKTKKSRRRSKKHTKSSHCNTSKNDIFNSGKFDL